MIINRKTGGRKMFKIIFLAVLILAVVGVIALTTKLLF